ncbi:MAG TPA: acyltransferase family protein [Solirubrobacteraceae bacterium]|nr:acyltransferase family protein [Solirubrobacteraceae bacterium]
MPGIDGLRAIAVAGVFVYHADGGWLPGGFLGVDMFFVISGYLITSLLLAEFAAEGKVKLLRFWAGRARRLLPALFLLLAVCLLVGATIERGKLVGLHDDALASIFYVANWRFIFGHESYFATFGRPGLLRHLWSLAVEEQFYLVWPPLFVIAMRALRRGRRRLALPLLVAFAGGGSAALMWALYVPGGNTSRIWYGTDTRAAPILVGVLLAFAWPPSAMPAWRTLRARRVLDATSLAALAAVIYMFATVHDYDQFLYEGGFLILALCSAVLLGAVAHPMSAIGRLLATRVPRWIGERSYGIYLWHWPILVFTRPGVDVHLARGILIPAQAAGTVIVAAVSYRFVETPIRSGALQRVRIKAPRWLAQPHTPAIVTASGLALLLGLLAATPSGVAALPPGFTKQALAQSQRASHHLVLPPDPAKTQTSSTTTTTTRTSTAGRHHRHHHHAAPPPVPTSGPILAVGDSVMLGASGALQSALGTQLHIDAVVSRQPEQTIARLFAYRAAGSLPRRVIVHVGDNGPVYYADVLRLRQALAGVPLVVLVNVRVATSWQSEVNSELAYAVKGWHEATIADWYDTSSGPGVVEDGTHTTPHGADLFAALIARAVHHPVLGGVTH